MTVKPGHGEGGRAESAAAWADAVCAILAEQSGLMAGLERLCGIQRELVRADDPDRLLPVLMEKEGLIAGLSAAAARLAPYRAAWGPMLAALDPARRETVRAKAAAVEIAAGRLAAGDEADRETLARRRDAAEHELKGLARGREAVRGYTGAGQPNGADARFQDREA